MDLKDLISFGQVYGMAGIIFLLLVSAIIYLVRQMRSDSKEWMEVVEANTEARIRQNELMDRNIQTQEKVIDAVRENTTAIANIAALVEREGTLNRASLGSMEKTIERLQFVRSGRGGG